MLPRGVAVSVLAVGTLTAVLGGGYILQQQGADLAPSDQWADVVEVPPEVPLPDKPVSTPSQPGPPPPNKPTPPSTPADATPGATPGGGGPPAAPRQPGPSQKSALDRILESLAKAPPQSAAVPGAPAAPPAVPPGPATPAPNAGPPLAVPVENFGPSAQEHEGSREVIVPGGQIVEVVLTKDLSSAEAKPEMSIEARITRSYRVGEDLALPENSRLIGLVTSVEQQGAIKGRGRVEFRFYSLRLPDKSSIAIETPVLRYEGPAPAGAVARKAGGAAAAGAVVGILLGGTGGAVRGATAGAAAAAAGTVEKKEPEPVVIPADVPFDVRIVNSVRVHVPIKRLN